MTEELGEAIEYIKKYREMDEKLYQTAPLGTVSETALTKCLRYWDMAIKALEQESVLDKIGAEIQENINYNKRMNYQGIVAGLLLTLDIIDKYRQEGYKSNEL